MKKIILKVLFLFSINSFAASPSVIKQVLEFEWLGANDILKIEETARLSCLYCFEFQITALDNAGAQITFGVKTRQDPQFGERIVVELK